MEESDTIDRQLSCIVLGRPSTWGRMETSHLWKLVGVVHCSAQGEGIIYMNYSVCNIYNHVCPVWEQNKENFPGKRNSIGTGLKFVYCV